MSDRKYKVLLLSDTALNDSDKTFTVPTGDRYRVLNGNINLVTTATAGNRQLDIQFRDASDTVLYTIVSGTQQPASLTRDYRLSHERDRDISIRSTVVDVAVDVTTIFSGPALLYSIYVNTTLSADALPIEDATVAKITVPASTTAGTLINFGDGVMFNTDLVVDPADLGTGNVTVTWRPLAEVTLPIPNDLVLLPGYDIRVFDSAVVDVAADDMVVYITVEDMNHKV